MMNLLNPMRKYQNLWEIAPHKGGGGGTSTGTTTSSTQLNKDFQPVVDDALFDLKALYDSGDLGKVAGVSDVQQMVFDAAPDALQSGIDAMDSARGTYQDAMDGVGMFDPADTEALKRAAIDQAAKETGINNDAMATNNMMGSSRAMIQAGDANAQLANALAQTDYDQANMAKEYAMGGANSMMQSGSGEADLLRQYTELGGVERAIEQEGLDGKAKALENYLTGMQVFTPLMSEQQQVSQTESTQKGGK